MTTNLESSNPTWIAMEKNDALRYGHLKNGKNVGKNVDKN